MHEITLNELITQIAKRYNLNIDALNNQNKEFHYQLIGNCILKVYNKNYNSECILYKNKDNAIEFERIEALIKSIQELQFFIKFGY